MDSARRFADTCARTVGPKMAHFTTANTARDMDLLRDVLGESKISYYGRSYGTYLGAVYTQLFGDRVDRVVLDSSVDPARTWRGMVLIWATAADAAFDRWTQWAARNDSTYHLGTTPEAVRQTTFDLIRKADDRPLGGFDSVGLRSHLRGRLFDVVQASDYIAALKAEAARPVEPSDDDSAEPSPEQLALAETTAHDELAAKDMFASQLMTIVCGEGRDWPRDLEQYRREAIEARTADPFGGDAMANVTPCAFWKHPSAEPPVTVNNTIGALILQNEWDSQTPLDSGTAMHQALRGSRM